jgi:hypothetical protein
LDRRKIDNRKKRSRRNRKCFKRGVIEIERLIKIFWGYRFRRGLNRSPSRLVIAKSSWIGIDSGGGGFWGGRGFNPTSGGRYTVVPSVFVDGGVQPVLDDSKEVW